MATKVIKGIQTIPFLFFSYFVWCVLNFWIVLVVACNWCNSHFNSHGGAIALKSIWPATRKEDINQQTGPAFTPPSPSLMCGNFAILRLLGWRRPTSPPHGFWLADRDTGHYLDQSNDPKEEAVSNQSAGRMCHSVAALGKENSAISNIPTLICFM